VKGFCGNGGETSGSIKVEEYQLTFNVGVYLTESMS
jgi:hypothetical protein